jgi:hypothetical protein
MRCNENEGARPEEKYIEVHLLLRTEIMCLVDDIISQLHLESGREHLAIRHRCGCIPNLDDVELPFG